MTMITPSYLGETIEYSSLHACRSTLEDPTLHTGQRLADMGEWRLRNDGTYDQAMRSVTMRALILLMLLVGSAAAQTHDPNDFVNPNVTTNENGQHVYTDQDGAHILPPFVRIETWQHRCVHKPDYPGCDKVGKSK